MLPARLKSSHKDRLAPRPGADLLCDPIDIKVRNVALGKIKCLSKDW